MRIERVLAAGGMFVLALLLMVLIHSLWMNASTRNMLTEAALNAKRNHLLTVTNVVDSWGNEAVFERIASETSIDYILTSKGADARLRTKDDIAVVVRDLNKSGMIGKWVGKKTKEFAKGVVNGLKDGSEFAKE